MADLPEGYKQPTGEEQVKAQTFFEYGKAKADTGNFDYAIELFLQGLALSPDAIEGHNALREVSLKRKASGGKDMGMFERMKTRRGGKDDKDAMLIAEKLLAYDPGNLGHMTSVFQAAIKGGFFDAALWMGGLLMKANGSGGKAEDAGIYITLKEGYKQLREWRLAVEACQAYVELRPSDIDQLTELKNLGAQETMAKGRYTTATSFVDSVRDMDGQKKLLDGDKGVTDLDVSSRMILEAQRAYTEEPTDMARLGRLVDALLKSEKTGNEEKAIELLETGYQQTQQFRYRQNIGRVRMRQWARQEQVFRAARDANPTDAQALADFDAYRKERAEKELEIYKLWAANYPTDMGLKYEVGVRMFKLGAYEESIPVFQDARNDPKHKLSANMALGRAFLEVGFAEEAADTLRAAIDEYAIKDDARAQEMLYFYGRALEAKGDIPEAIKAYSTVARANFGYRDVQTRIKELRASQQQAPKGT